MLPIGLAVFAGISVIALIVVGLVTYERTKYRKVGLYLLFIYLFGRPLTVIALSFRHSGNGNLRKLDQLWDTVAWCKFFAAKHSATY